LVELMVAMMATLIVSGAIFGLLAGGNNAFRREPELSERQENIRVAMDMITRDVVTAGGGMDAFVQAFTDGLNNPPLATSWPSALIAGESADFLQITGNDGSCPTLAVCGAPGNSLFFNDPLPACLANTLPSLGYVYGANGAHAQGSGLAPGVLYFDKVLGGGGCGSGHLNKPQGGSAVNPPGNVACGAGGNATTNTPDCQFMTRVQVVRYQIAADVDDPTGQTPALWRSPAGTIDITGTNAGNLPPNAPWQLVAEGIEDLQVRYLSTQNGWQDTPGAMANGNYGTIIRQVQITLSARSMAPNLAGQSTSAVGNAVRGQLASTVSPRAAQLALQQGNQWK
jgi:hypothetical protein